MAPLEQVSASGDSLPSMMQGERHGRTCAAGIGDERAHAVVAGCGRIRTQDEDAVAGYDCPGFALPQRLRCASLARETNGPGRNSSGAVVLFVWRSSGARPLVKPGAQGYWRADRPDARRAPSLCRCVAIRLHFHALDGPDRMTERLLRPAVSKAVSQVMGEVN